jgi:hypothetical protein
VRPTELSLAREKRIKEKQMPPKGHGEWGYASKDFIFAYDPMAGVKEYQSQMQSIHNLPIPGLEKPKATTKAIPVVEARVSSNHRKFRDE